MRNYSVVMDVFFQKTNRGQSAYLEDAPQLPLRGNGSLSGAMLLGGRGGPLKKGDR